MRHNIVFKFLAILLCAACLMGAAAAGAGILVMTEANLYQRSPEEAYRETLKNYAESYAGDMALRYAAKELGGAAEALVEDYYGSPWYEDVFDFNGVGYVLFEEEDKPLQEKDLGAGQEVYTFRFQPTGRYIRVLSEMTEEEYRATQISEGTVTELENGTVYNAIEEGGSEVAFIEMEFLDGSSENLGAYDAYLGTVYSNFDGTVEFFSAEGIDLIGSHMSSPLTRLSFRSRSGESIYEITSPEGITSEGSYSDGMTYLMLYSTRERSFTHDAIPEGGCEAANVYIAYADGFSESMGGSPSIGFLDYEDQGRVRFVSNGHIFTAYGDIVTHIRFEDVEGNVLFEARDPEGVGYVSENDQEQWFLTEMILAPEDSAEEAHPAVTEAPAEEPVPDATAAEETCSGTVTAYTNIYASASLTAPVTGFLTAGTPVEIGQQVTEAGLSWGWIPGSGWVLMDSIALSDGLTDNAPANANEELKVEDFLAEVQQELNIHLEPDGASEVVGTYAPGDIVSVITSEVKGIETWARTDQGWVNQAMLIPVELPTTEFEIIPLEEDSAEVTVDPTEETSVPTEETSVPTEEATLPSETAVEEIPEATEPVMAMAAEGSEEIYSYYDQASHQRKYVHLGYEELPGYTVTVQLTADAFQYSQDWLLIRLVYEVSDYLIYILVGSLLLFAIFAVYLCCAAGRKPGSKEVKAGGLNAMPLELYAGICGCGITLLALLGVEGTEYLLKSDLTNGILCALLSAYGVCLLIVAFCFCCAAQFKTPGGYWWRNSLCGLTVRLLWKLCKWLLKGFEKLDGIWDKKLWPGIKALFRWAFGLAVLVAKQIWQWAGKLLRFAQNLLQRMGRAMNRFFSMLPLTWQWLLSGGAMIFFLFITVAGRFDTGIVLSILFGIALVMYGAHCFGCLLESARKMSKGDLEEKVDDKLMVGAFKDFAGELNGLADVAVVAAQKQLKSERMKTELITNVSHDIKTPPTSIINYVDLLQKPHSPEDQEKYLEVLDRQSQRLKKLIDDLMEMSKASTGNMSVDISRMDAAEAVNQALGEFADKLEKARLYPVFRQPEEQIYMLADGRLVWRVMSNLLGNAVKYALPGTRLYVDLQKVDTKVIISLKNISREELNVEADELLERFVRGDASRNTEGSGLGLNIAQSLMELQKGQLQILVDGDLFKVTLIFPSE